jgi:hypothetical protein
MLRIISSISVYLFSTGCFICLVYQTALLCSARLCAKPLALTRSFHVFTSGICPRFLKNFLIFDRVKNNKILKPGQVPAFRRNSPLKYPLCGSPAGFENLPVKTARRFPL